MIKFELRIKFVYEISTIILPLHHKLSNTNKIINQSLIDKIDNTFGERKLF